MSTESSSKRELLETKNTQVIAVLAGAAIASIVTLAVSVLIINVTEIPLILAYGILILLAFIAFMFVIYWWRRGELTRKIFGVSLRSFGEIFEDASQDVVDKDYQALVVHRSRELIATYSAIRIRTAILSFMVVLFGEFILLINASMIIQQTSAVRAQTTSLTQQNIFLENQNELFDSQNALLERQNILLAQRDKFEVFWQMYNDEDITARSEHFAQLLELGVRNFNGISLVRANLRNRDLNAIWIENSDLTASFFNDAIILDSSFDGTDLSYSDFQNVDMNAAFRDAILDGATFEGADFSEATLDGASLQGADFSGATGLTVELLSTTKSLESATGIPDEILEELERDFPDLFDAP